MSVSMQSLFELRAKHFLSGDYARLTQFYRYPFALYFEDDLSVVKTPFEMGALLQRFRLLCESRQVVRMVPNIFALTPMRNGKQSVWVNWDWFDAQGSLVDTSECRYMLYQRASDPWPVVELLEYRDCASVSALLAAPVRRRA